MCGPELEDHRRCAASTIYHHSGEDMLLTSVDEWQFVELSLATWVRTSIGTPARCQALEKSLAHHTVSRPSPLGP